VTKPVPSYRFSDLEPLSSRTRRRALCYTTGHGPHVANRRVRVLRRADRSAINAVAIYLFKAVVSHVSWCDRCGATGILYTGRPHWNRHYYPNAAIDPSRTLPALVLRGCRADLSAYALVYPPFLPPHLARLDDAGGRRDGAGNLAGVLIFPVRYNVRWKKWQWVLRQR
jgi:hypothetical protein